MTLLVTTMSNMPESNIDLAQRADLDSDRLKDGATQDEQPESGTVREDDAIRQSAPTSTRLDEKSMEAPEEA